MESAPYYLFAVFCWILAVRNFRDPRFLVPFLRLFVPTTLYLAGLMLSSDYVLFWRPDDRIWFPFRISYFNAYPHPLPKLSTVLDALTDTYFASANLGYLTETPLRMVGHPAGRAIAR